MAKKSELEKSSTNYTPLVRGMIIVFLIWLIFWIVFSLLGPKIESRGLIGDSFGVINSLFSALAFAGIIYTIILQRNELKLQREELEETRKELKRSADAQSRSEEQLRRQSENLKQTARLNALDTLVNFYIREENKNLTRDPNKKDDAIRRQNQYIQEIQKILDNKSLRNLQ